jgi:DNA-binding NarL/FixJ family response regulator
VEQVINIIIGGGRKLLREGIAVLLERQATMRVVGEAPDLQGAIKLLRPMAARIAIFSLDARQEAAAKATISEITANHPTVRVIALSSNPTGPAIKELFAHGLAGCLTKDCTSEELIAAIRSVDAGRTYICSRVTELLVRGSASSLARRRRSLTSREQDVLCRIASGETTKEIAFALNVSSKTVETYRRRAMEKLNCHSVAALTQYAVAKGLIELPAFSEV